MNDLGQILSLWRGLENAGAEYVLATVVSVEGSSYRKPGARMLLAQDGRRAGTVSGGCLEAEVARRAWWLTASGPVVERYSTQDDEDERPYGSGCGGVVYLLLERKATAGPLLAALESAFKARIPVGIATVIEGARIGSRTIFGDSSFDDSAAATQRDLKSLAHQAFATRTTQEQRIELDGATTRVLAEYRPARTSLWIFGAGDDAKPLVELAHGLGWYVVVADGRSHLATRERFAAADEVLVLPIADLPARSRQHISLRRTDSAVVMTHSFEQDAHILALIFGLDTPLAYSGVLGPQRRTRELLAEAARLLHLPDASDRVDRWLSQMHAPTGLDLGADTPATIALSILAEIQKALTAASGQPLHQVRGVKDLTHC
ncbi:MAG TPA: XdhC family protein [Terracidiphilus sp.]|nr:XdhC family protein [Terracidiphilus sp.]